MACDLEPSQRAALASTGWRLRPLAPDGALAASVRASSSALSRTYRAARGASGAASGVLEASSAGVQQRRVLANQLSRRPVDIHQKCHHRFA